MRSPLVRYGVVPGLALLVVTSIRFWLEYEHPASPATRWISAFALTIAFLLVSPAFALREGLPFRRYLAAIAIFMALQRAPLGLIYGWAWRTQATDAHGQPIRYLQDLFAQMNLSPDTSAWFVVFMATVVPFVVHLAFATLVWFATWALAFRGKRPALAAA